MSCILLAAGALPQKLQKLLIKKHFLGVILLSVCHLAGRLGSKLAYIRDVPRLMPDRLAACQTV